jgi:hypothetical protein
MLAAAGGEQSAQTGGALCTSSRPLPSSVGGYGSDAPDRAFADPRPGRDRPLAQALAKQRSDRGPSRLGGCRTADRPVALRALSPRTKNRTFRIKRTSPPPDTERALVSPRRSRQSLIASPHLAIVARGRRRWPGGRHAAIPTVTPSGRPLAPRIGHQATCARPIGAHAQEGGSRPRPVWPHEPPASSPPSRQPGSSWRLPLAAGPPPHASQSATPTRMAPRRRQCPSSIARRVSWRQLPLPAPSARATISRRAGEPAGPPDRAVVPRVSHSPDPRRPMALKFSHGSPDQRGAGPIRPGPPPPSGSGHRGGSTRSAARPSGSGPAARGRAPLAGPTGHPPLTASRADQVHAGQTDDTIDPC